MRQLLGVVCIGFSASIDTLTSDRAIEERTVQTGVGDSAVKVARIQDLTDSGVRFRGTLPPRCLKQAKSVEVMLPWLHLRGVSAGDSSNALKSLLGEDAPRLPANTISPLKQRWTAG